MLLPSYQRKEPYHTIIQKPKQLMLAKELLKFHFEMHNLGWFLSHLLSKYPKRGEYDKI